jgi:hypothetical protein
LGWEDPNSVPIERFAGRAIPSKLISRRIFGDDFRLACPDDGRATIWMSAKWANNHKTSASE